MKNVCTERRALTSNWNICVWYYLYLAVSMLTGCVPPSCFHHPMPDKSFELSIKSVYFVFWLINLKDLCLNHWHLPWIHHLRHNFLENSFWVLQFEILPHILLLINGISVRGALYTSSFGLLVADYNLNTIIEGIKRVSILLDIIETPAFVRLDHRYCLILLLLVLHVKDKFQCLRRYNTYKLL